MLLLFQPLSIKLIKTKIKFPVIDKVGECARVPETSNNNLRFP